MPICVKCNTSIKPAALETKVSGESYHPTCVSCAICDRKLWGKPFKRNNGKLECEDPCKPAAIKRPGTVTLGPATSRLHDSHIPKPIIDSIDDFLPKTTQPKTNQSPTPKLCKICAQSVIGKRFITYENGDIICSECDAQTANKPARVKSAHLIICSVCNQTVRGSRYTTEPDLSITCENCQLTGDRCHKCHSLFKHDEETRKLLNGLTFHESCFNCSSCTELISTNDFYTDNTGVQICANCYNMSKLPTCSMCKKAIQSACIIVENNPVHRECFKCAECGCELNQETGLYKNESNSPICYKCYLRVNGAKCGRCMAVIERDGVTFGERHFHFACYKCDKCGVDLMRMRKTLTDRDAQALFCEPCFVKSFAPKCAKCSEVIMPYRASTVYEGRSFHRECFACARCRKTLADKKFFKAGTILICENCY